MLKKNSINFFSFLQVLCFTILIVLISSFSSQAQTQGSSTLTLAIIKDGSSSLFDPVNSLVVSELKEVVAKNKRIVVKDLPAFDVSWDVQRFEQAFRQALQDPDIDIIYTGGVLATRFAALTSIKLTKPVVGAVLQQTEAIGLPLTQSGYSEKENFVFFVIPQNASRDIATFKRLKDFQILHVIVDEKIIDGVPKIGAYADTLEKENGINIKLVPASESAADTLARLGEGVEAAYVAALHRMSDQEIDLLIGGLNTRKIPSFALLGHVMVERGVLAGLMPDMQKQWARRIALNIQQVSMGVSPNELQVRMVAPDKLLINANTAKLIGVSPDLSMILDAKIIGDLPVSIGKKLSLEKAMNIASDKNVDLAIEKSSVESLFQAKKKAVSRLLPQLAGNADFTQIDVDRAEASNRTISRRTVTAGATLRQMIYDDTTVTEYKIAGLQYEGGVFNQDSVLLDVIEQSGKIYLQSLSDLAVLRIAQENLNLTQQNLKLARIRREVGVAGPEEIYRWEAEEAQQKNDLIASRQQVSRSFVSLNQAIGVGQDTKWSLEDILIDDKGYYFLGNQFADYMSRTDRVKVFRKFSIENGLKNAPELRVVEKEIGAQQLTVNRLRRRFYLPSLNADFSYQNNIDEDFEGNRLTAQPVEEADDDEWTISVKLSVPLFESGGRLDDLRKATADYKRLLSSRERIRQLIEKRTQTAVFNIYQSRPNIFLSRIAAERAGKNLELVQDNYAKGKASIIDLIDAQRNKISQDQAAAVAVYQFLSDMVEYQRAISWFEFVKSEKEKIQWLKDLWAYSSPN